MKPRGVVPFDKGVKIMLGTAINVGAILAGSVIGVSIGSRLPERLRQTVLNGLGLLTLLVGLQMALGTGESHDRPGSHPARRLSGGNPEDS